MSYIAFGLLPVGQVFLSNGRAYRKLDGETAVRADRRLAPSDLATTPRENFDRSVYVTFTPDLGEDEPVGVTAQPLVCEV